MAQFKRNSWWCDGCDKWHGLSRDIEADGITTGGSWCGPSIRRGIKTGRNLPLPGFVIEGFRREMAQ